MRPELAVRPRLRRALRGLPVVAVGAALSAAAVVGLVRGPSPDAVATLDSSTFDSRPPASSSPPPLDPGQPPDDLPDIGTYGQATVGPDGAVTVTEWVRTAVPTTTVTLSLPSGSPTSGSANEVAVTSAEGTAAGPAELVSSGSYDFAQPSTVFVAHYVLEGVTRISPMSPTRALVQPVALVLAVGPSGGEAVGGPRVLSVEAGTVLALACSAPEDKTVLTPCGAPHDEGWQVELDSRGWSDLVVAQVDLV